MVASRNNDSVKQLWPLPDGAARDKMGPMRMRTMVLISPMTGVTRECLPLPADIDDGGADGKPLITVSTGLLDDIKAFSVGGLEHKHLQRMVRFLMSDRPELTDDLVEEVISQAQDTEMTSEEATLMMWNIIYAMAFRQVEAKAKAAMERGEYNALVTWYAAVMECYNRARSKLDKVQAAKKKEAAKQAKKAKDKAKAKRKAKRAARRKG